jgi:hypothetical protein
MWDFVIDKSGAGEGFLRELRFPHSICFSTIIFTITRGWHNRPEWPQCQLPHKKKEREVLRDKFILMHTPLYRRSRDSVFGIATGYGLDDVVLEFESG